MKKLDYAVIRIVNKFLNLYINTLSRYDRYHADFP